MSLPHQGRPTKINDDMLTEVKSVLHNLQASGGSGSPEKLSLRS